MKSYYAVPGKTACGQRRLSDADHRFRRAALLLLGSALAYGSLWAPANADAVKPPSRIANIYGGLNHQPTRSEVENRERAARIGPSARQQSADDEVLRRLYQELTERARAG
jgi:hypothetical protein